MLRRGTQQPLYSTQPDTIDLLFRVDGSAGASAVIQEGLQDAVSLVRNSAGNFTINVPAGSTRELGLIGATVHADATIDVDATNSTITVITKARATGTPTDYDFTVSARVFFDKLQR